MNVSFANPLPTTNCKIPMAGTQEFKDWKAHKQVEQADSFNGKTVEDKTPSILNKIVNVLKNFENTFIL